MRQMAEACYEPMPPLPEDYPSQLHVSDTWTDEPVVVWLIPFWEAGDEPQQSRSVRPRRDTESESVTARLNRLTKFVVSGPGGGSLGPERRRVDKLVTVLLELVVVSER
jgi:hypothetical protein